MRTVVVIVFFGLSLACTACQRTGPQMSALRPGGSLDVKPLTAAAAEQAYQLGLHAIESQPTEISAYLATGNAALVKKDYEAAAMAFEGAMILQENHPEAFFGLAQAYEGLGADQLALGYFLTLRRLRNAPLRRYELQTKIDALYLKLTRFTPEPHQDRYFTRTPPAGTFTCPPPAETRTFAPVAGIHAPTLPAGVGQ